MLQSSVAVVFLRGIDQFRNSAFGGSEVFGNGLTLSSRTSSRSSRAVLSARSTSCPSNLDVRRFGHRTGCKLTARNNLAHTLLTSGNNRNFAGRCVEVKHLAAGNIVAAHGAGGQTTHTLRASLAGRAAAVRHELRNGRGTARLPLLGRHLRGHLDGGRFRGGGGRGRFGLRGGSLRSRGRLSSLRRRSSHRLAGFSLCLAISHRRRATLNSAFRCFAVDGDDNQHAAESHCRAQNGNRPGQGREQSKEERDDRCQTEEQNTNAKSATHIPRVHAGTNLSTTVCTVNCSTTGRGSILRAACSFLRAARGR